MSLFVTGAIAMGFGVAGLFFLRFWKDTQDRLFAFFALAFLLQAVSRVWFAIQELEGDPADHVYWVRLLAFLLILGGIIDKNRTPTPRGN